MSDRELTSLGLGPGSLGLTDDVQTEGAFEGLPGGADVVQAVSALESRFYQGNMLLRDADVNGMAHGLEIRVPFLDRRLLDAVHAMPGQVRLPAGAPAKYLLRQAFPDLIRPELLARPKTGFTLPIRNWMLGPLRGLCEDSLRACVDVAGLPEGAVRAIWDEFVAEPHGPQWTRAWSLCAAGHYLRRHLSPGNA
jgi:asparagine synthase (glutamine-hydrolysing)